VAPIVRAVVRQEPPVRHGYPPGRWKLAAIRAAIPWLASYSLSGISRLVRRAGLRLKRGRLRLHSPDPDYPAKSRQLTRILALARQYPQRIALLYADEVSISRQPSLAATWAPVGVEPTTTQIARSNTVHRVCGALNATTGQLSWITAAKCTVSRLKTFLRTLRTAYPDRWLFVVWDNWLPHRHAEVEAEAKRLHLHLLFLPTYAPWLNPIEKVWRWLKQEVVHGHRLAEDWEGLKQAVNAFLRQFAHPSPALLQYTGLCPD
jgi:transposase